VTNEPETEVGEILNVRFPRPPHVNARIVSLSRRPFLA
jgi:hypothetical protein